MTDFQSPQKLIISRTVTAEGHGSATDFLARESGLSKAEIKGAMTTGAVLLQRSKTRKRLRRATSEVRTGDILTLAYNADILARTPPPATLVSDQPEYSVWNKPAGMLSQGTEWGDHCSLLRQIETLFKQKRQVFLVHRLDREALGLMLIAHTKKTAAALSKMFQENRMEKIYRAGRGVGPSGSRRRKRSN